LQKLQQNYPIPAPILKKRLAAVHPANPVAKSANQGNVNAKFNYKPALCDASLAL
jgi:hypothetical protein